jgi:hypothetical protein
VSPQYEDAVGTPLDPDTYDYVGSVLWQAHAGKLWRRFTIAVGRKLARALGIRPGELREVMRLSYAKVAEYQRRGLIHVHAVVRIDGPEGPDGPPPPAEVTEDVLTAVIQAAAASVTVRTPESPAVGVLSLTWGEQVDVEPIAVSEGTTKYGLPIDPRNFNRSWDNRVARSGRSPCTMAAGPAGRCWLTWTCTLG